MKVFLTGATGFVGSHLAKALVARGHEVHALVRSSAKAESLRQLKVNLIPGNLESSSALQSQLPSIDVVLHVAGLIKAGSIEEFYRINVEGTRSLLEAFSNQPLQKFIFVSTIAARGPNRHENDQEGKGPVSHYGKSKREAEDVVCGARSHFPVITFRPPIVYGPRDLETFTLFKMFQRGLFPLIASGVHRASFIHVKNLVDVLVQAVEKPYREEGPFYPEDGQGGYSWKGVVEIASKAYGKKILTPPMPLSLVKVAAYASGWWGRLTGKTPMLSAEKFQEIREPHWVCSSESCESLYPLSDPIRLERGLRETREWYIKEGWL